MSQSSFYIQNIAELITTKQTLFGGSKSTSMSPKVEITFVSFLLALLFIFLKGLIVYLGYNLIMPKLIYSVDSSKKSLLVVEESFRPLSYWESVILVILTNTLF